MTWFRFVRLWTRFWGKHFSFGRGEYPAISCLGSFVLFLFPYFLHLSRLLYPSEATHRDEIFSLHQINLATSNTHSHSTRFFFSPYLRLQKNKAGFEPRSISLFLSPKFNQNQPHANYSTHSLRYVYVHLIPIRPSCPFCLLFLLLYIYLLRYFYFSLAHTQRT